MLLARLFIKQQKIILLILLSLVSFCLISYHSLNLENNLENRVVKLGNPLTDDGQTDRALNIWDLQVFEGKIYLGGGSTVTNAGPVGVWAYDPNTQEFVREYSIDE